MIHQSVIEHNGSIVGLVIRISSRRRYELYAFSGEMGGWVANVLLFLECSTGSCNILALVNQRVQRVTVHTIKHGMCSSYIMVQLDVELSTIRE